MFAEELMLLVVGMGIVFVFLAILVLVTQWTSVILMKATEKKQEEHSTQA